MQTFVAVFPFVVALSLFLCEGCYHSGYLVRAYTRNDGCSGDICSIEGIITPGSDQPLQLQIAVFSDPADNNGSLSQLSRTNLTQSGTFYPVPEVKFTWGTARRVIVLLICLTDDSNCSLLEARARGKTEFHRFPCPAQSKCHLCPHQREVLDNYNVSFGHGLSIIDSDGGSTYSNDCPIGTTHECIAPSSTADLTSVEATAISIVTSRHGMIDFPTTSTSIDAGSATSTAGICITSTTSPMSSEIPTCDGSGVRPFSKLSLLLLVLCAAVTLGVMCG